jgi:hypothetical protein
VSRRAWQPLPLLWPFYLAALLMPLPQLLLLPWRAQAFQGEALMLIYMILAVWYTVAAFHVKILLAARELRVPGVPRRLLLATLAFAAVTFLVMRVPALLTPGAPVLWPEMIVCGICTGCLFALCSAWALPLIAFALGVLLFYSGFQWPLAQGAVSRAQLGLVALLLPLAVAARGWWVLSGLSRGARPAFLNSGWYGGAEGGVPRRPAGGFRWRASRRGARSPAAAVRAALGPEFGAHSLGVLLFLAPVLFPFAPRWPAWLAIPLCFGPMSGGLWVYRHVERLAALLGAQGGEIVDLALLPGLGDLRQRQRALIGEALIRPLLQGGLCLAGIAAADWALLVFTGAPLAPLLPLGLLAAGLLLLHATLTMGVLAGRLRPRSPWMAAVFVFVPSSLLAMHDLRAGAQLSQWQAISWGAGFAALAVCLIVWAVQLRRRPPALLLQG